MASYCGRCLASLAIAVSVAGSFIATQRRGLDAIERLVRRMIPAAAEQTAAVAVVISEAYNRPVRVAVCLVVHVLCWFGAAGGSWLILDFIGHPLPFFSVVAIESLLFAIRNAAFVVPSGLGVQEGSYALLGPLFGLPAEAALALSLLKRARDIVIGVPVLLLWQLMEEPPGPCARRSATDRERYLAAEVLVVVAVIRIGPVHPAPVVPDPRIVPAGGVIDDDRNRIGRGARTHGEAARAGLPRVLGHVGAEGRAAEAADDGQPPSRPPPRARLEPITAPRMPPTIAPPVVRLASARMQFAWAQASAWAA